MQTYSPFAHVEDIETGLRGYLTETAGSWGMVQWDGFPYPIFASYASIIIADR